MLGTAASRHARGNWRSRLELTTAVNSTELLTVEARQRRMRVPIGLWPLIAYLTAITVIGKGPTYLGFPPLFWGELVLAWTVLWSAGQYGLRAFLWSGPFLLTVCIMLFVFLGAVLTMPGCLSYGVAAIRDAALWYYCALFFVGAALARDTEAASAFWLKIRWLWVLAVLWYLLAYFLFPQVKEAIIVKTRGVPLLGSSTSELIMHCGLAAVLLSLGIRPVMFRTEVFPALLAFSGVMAVALTTGRGVKLAILAAFSGIFIVILWRGSRFLNRFLFGAMFFLLITGLVVTVTLVEKPVATATHVDRFSREELGRSTGAWRTSWWKSLYDRVNRDSPFLGLGFGQSLSIYSPYLKGDEKNPWPVRSPHSVNMTVFARMGYVGALVWLCILALGVGGLWYKLLQPGVSRVNSSDLAESVFWASLLTAAWVNSSFGVLMEGPVLGFWFWFALGFGHARFATFMSRQRASVNQI